MRFSRGMGAISKEKVRAIKKRDGNEPVKVFKAGGGVKKFAKGGKPTFRISGGGGRVTGPDSNISSVGGRASVEIPLAKMFTVSPYIEGFHVRGTAGRQKIKDSGISGGGVNLNYNFKAGGDTNWIAGAIKKPGALRASLGVKGGKPIPAGKLAKAARAPGIMGRRARLAQTLKKFNEGGSVNEAGNYTKPTMRKKIVSQVKAAATHGTKAGQWSARKAQLVAKKYKEAGGGYTD